MLFIFGLPIDYRNKISNHSLEHCTILNIAFQNEAFFFSVSIQEVPSLVRETRVEDWDVFTCINCNTDTHALHSVKKYDRVLISRALEVRKDLTVSFNMTMQMKINNTGFIQLFIYRKIRLWSCKSAGCLTIVFAKFLQLLS